MFLSDCFEFSPTDSLISLAAILNPVGETVTPSPLPPNPCNPPPCGLNSQCQVVAGQAQCACLTNMVGNPPDCRPECVLSSNCRSNEACVNQKCVDPCAGTCGPNADCRVVNHAPSCSCQPGFSGNAFADCRPISSIGKNQNLIISFAITVCVFLFVNHSTCFFQLLVYLLNSQKVATYHVKDGNSICLKNRIKSYIGYKIITRHCY